MTTIKATKRSQDEQKRITREIMDERACARGRTCARVYRCARMRTRVSSTRRLCMNPHESAIFQWTIPVVHGKIPCKRAKPIQRMKTQANTGY